MPSRKKAKGQARRAAKAEAEAAAKKNEAKEGQAVAINQQEDASLVALLNRLGINVANTPEQCKHGYPPMSPRDEKILQDFMNAFNAVYSSQDNNMVDDFVAAYQATKDEYSDVYYNQMHIVVPRLVSIGAQHIIEGNNHDARVYSVVVCFFEEWTAVNVRKTKATFSWTKMIELDCADDHTLVQYYRKRIPCSCLDKKYKEVKSVKKLGWCCNPNCSKPNHLVERSKMFCCSRCGETNYCSSKCQKAHWKMHRESCDIDVKKKAAFDSEQQS